MAPTVRATGGDPIPYSLLLRRGLIRIGLDVPDGRHSLSSVDDPFHREALLTGASMYRRPL